MDIMKNILLIVFWIFIRSTVGQMDEATEVPPNHDLGDASIANVQATVDSSTSISVQWDAPTQDNWANNFRVSVTATNLGQCNVAGDTTVGEWIDADTTETNEVLLSSLSPYTSYTIEVTPGTLDTDTGEIVPGTSMSLQETTNPEAPEAVTALTVTTVTSDVTQLAVSWEYNPTHEQCDLFIVEYMLTNRDQCPDLPQGTRLLFSNMDIAKTVTLTELLPYSTYTVFVRAMNDVGMGDEVSADGTTSNAAPSAAPANPQVDTASSSDVGLTFTWEGVPCGSQGGGITGYRYSLVQQGGSFDDSNTVDTGSSDRMVTVNGLTCNTEYIFRVAAVSSAGAGPFSSTITATSTFSNTEAFAADNQTTITDITASTAQINWQTGGCTSPETTYTISHQLTNREQCQALGTGGPTATLDAVTGGQTTATIGNLEGYSSYTVTVTGAVPGGTTSTVTNTFETAQGVPEVSPGSVQIGTVTTTSLAFSWDAIACGQRTGVITYRYAVTASGQFVSGGDTTSTSASAIGLSAGTTYFVTITALTAFGTTGPSSTAVSASTGAAPADEVITNPDGQVCTSCTPNRVVAVSILIVQIAGVTAIFTVELNNPASQQYQSLSILFTVALQPSCDALPGCLGIRINSFFSGSIGVNYDYIFPPDSTTTTAQVQNAIVETAAEQDNSGGLGIDTTRTTVEDYCPPGFCSNGGTCISDTQQQMGFCMCANGFGGTTCIDVVPTTPSSGGGGGDGGSGGGDNGGSDSGILAITVSSVSLVLLLIVSLFALGMIIYVRILRPRKLRRQMQFRRPHPQAMLGRDPLLVDPVSLASPWSYRQATTDGNAYYATTDGNAYYATTDGNAYYATTDDNAYYGPSFM